jgi:hypothetical protein
MTVSRPSSTQIGSVKAKKPGAWRFGLVDQGQGINWTETLLSLSCKTTLGPWKHKKKPFCAG